MTRDEFIAAIIALGFIDDGGGMYEKDGIPYRTVHVYDADASSLYSYGGDTGPIELTVPERMPFAELLEDLRKAVRSDR